MEKVILVFGSQWCPSCKLLDNVLNEVTTKDGILSIPLMVLIEDEKEVDRYAGYRSKKQIEKIIDKFKQR